MRGGRIIIRLIPALIADCFGKTILVWFILWFIWDALVFTSAVFAGICVFRVGLT